MTAELLSLLHHLPRASAADPMRVAVIGTGYVGLVTGTCLAALGHKVACVDIDPERVATLRRGMAPFYEPGLEALMQRVTTRLSFTSDIVAAATYAEVILLAVGTPSMGGGTDLSQVTNAIAAINGALLPGAVVVIKSTVPAGTAAQVERMLREAGHPNSVASNPEFLREGTAISDFLRADRVVIGVAESHAETVLRRLYEPLTSARIPLVVTSRTNAEMIKHAANGFLAMKIAFINEVADLCERTGGDVDDVARALGLDVRIGGHFLRAGPGYGGSCFPKDTHAFAELGRQHGAPLRLIEAAMASNQARREGLGARVAGAIGRDVTGLRIAILGLAFKPNTDDMRESPALPLIRDLQAAGAVLCACDPRAVACASRIFPGLACFEDPYRACEGADAAVIVTDWEAFRLLDLGRLRSMMSGNLLVDFRNQFDPSEAAKSGLRYVSIGRPSVEPSQAAETGGAVVGVSPRRRPAAVWQERIARLPDSGSRP